MSFATLMFFLTFFRLHLKRKLKVTILLDCTSNFCGNLLSVSFFQYDWYMEVLKSQMLQLYRELQFSDTYAVVAYVMYITSTSQCFVEGRLSECHPFSTAAVSILLDRLTTYGDGNKTCKYIFKLIFQLVGAISKQ